jgi:two-component system LytT family sensor kinase
MKIPIDRERFKVYLRIGAAYFLLSAFGELVGNPDTFFKGAWNNLWLLVYLVVLNYIFYEFALPHVKFTWKSLIVGPVLLFVLAMFCSFGFYAWRSIGVAFHLYFPIGEAASISDRLQELVPFSFFSVFFFGVARHVFDYRKLKLDAQQLRIEKQEAELNYLKSQTNPHFLFNTLNNIYSLARDKSDLAPESILRLSKILRFMLYETGGDYIAIEQELKIMNDYIALEKLRYDDSLHVNFNHDIEDMKQAIPPLLLIPLVENAFKHGASETRSRPFVDIHLSVKSRQLLLTVKNSAESFFADEPVKENIGLANLRRQLELLYTDYNLSVQQRESVFTASLKINLASHV